VTVASPSSTTVSPRARIAATVRGVPTQSAPVRAAISPPTPPIPSTAIGTGAARVTALGTRVRRVPG
jgi:hypothetical protein